MFHKLLANLQIVAWFVFFIRFTFFPIVSFAIFTFKACLPLALWHQQQDPFHLYLVLALRGSTPSSTIREALGGEKMAK